MAAAAKLYGGIELGGTKTVCLIGAGPDDIRAQTRFATRTPEATLGEAIGFFRGQAAEHGLPAAIGIASFGPVDLDRASPGWGRVAATPKPGWSGADVAGAIRTALGVPVAFDTDVNGAALAEGRWGAARRLADFVYVTVGTGIGGGAVAGGRLVHGVLHPEMGHMAVPRDPEDAYPGRCPFHGDCLEGLACGPAIEERWGRRCPDLPADHPAWPLQASYLSALAVNLIYTLSPQRLIFGGGVMQAPHVWEPLRRVTSARLAGYLKPSLFAGPLDDLIVPPALGDRAGPLGALALAENPADFGG